jgi:hypothetical protein
MEEVAVFVFMIKSTIPRIEVLKFVKVEILKKFKSKSI